MRARYYDPIIGRFITEDSVRSSKIKLSSGIEIEDPLSLNLYTYCYNNPIALYDTSGHEGVDIGQMFHSWLNGLMQPFTGNNSTYMSDYGVKNIDDKNKYSTITNINSSNDASFYLGNKTTEFLQNNDIVFDFSLSVSDGTIGYSKVTSVGKGYNGEYIHTGYGKGISLLPVSISTGFGIVKNANKPEDYAGDFFDHNANLGIGFDYCYWPGGASAKSLTFSTSPSIQLIRYDNYILVRDQDGGRFHFSILNGIIKVTDGKEK